MKLCNLDRPANAQDYSPALGPIGMCLQMLDTLLRSPQIAWDLGQRQAIEEALRDAWAVMMTDALTLAGRHFPNAEPQAVEAVRDSLHYVAPPEERPGPWAAPYSREEAYFRVMQTHGGRQ